MVKPPQFPHNTQGLLNCRSSSDIQMALHLLGLGPTKFRALSTSWQIQRSSHSNTSSCSQQGSTDLLAAQIFFP